MQPYTLTASPWHIRPWRHSDVEQLTVICQDPLIQRWTAAVPIPYTRADAEFLVLELSPKGWAEGNELFWAIADPSTDELLGAISLRIRHGNGGDIGYWLAPAGRGRGVATRAVAEVCREGFRLGMQVIHWEAIEGNEASRRVAERVGFAVTGPLRRLLFQRGDWVDGWVGTLLPDDLPIPRPVLLTDGVVTLRAPRGEDLAALPDLVDEQVLAWTGVPGRSPAELGPWLDVARRPDRPPAARFAITAEHSGELLGFLRLSQEPMAASTTVGWWVGAPARGQGFAYRAVRLAMEWAVSQGAHRFAAGIFDGNAASVALAERLGMRSEGLRRSYWPPRNPGEPRRDTWLYSLVPSDPGWPTVAQSPG
ncbi:MAG TPA: GNAT family N-acetyltransferase [Frankiaceae bacterium]|nr:GNAT family N-acetyltransferase [Frankiaceae bacterium]